MERELIDDLANGVAQIHRAFRKAGMSGTFSVRVDSLVDAHILRRIEHPDAVHPTIYPPNSEEVICKIRGVDFVDGTR